jgi:hypothetical protein
VSSHTFISHSASDESTATWWCQALESEGLACWVAPRDIPPGADWAAEIIEGLDAAYAMLLLLTASAMQSPQVRREVERAVHKEIPVIALRLDPEPLSKSLEYFLSAQHWIDARDRVHEAHRSAVIGALAAALRADRRPGDGRGSRPPMVKEPGAPTRPPAALIAWNQEQLSAMAARLATYVGPVAAVLVERASRRARDEGELIEMLAKEVDDRSARDRFIAEVRGRIERPAST